MPVSHIVNVFEHCDPVEVCLRDYSMVIFNGGLVTCCAIVLFVLKNDDVIAYHISGFNVDQTVINTIETNINHRKIQKLLIFSQKFTGQNNADNYLRNAKILADTFHVNADYFVAKDSRSYSMVIIMTPVRIINDYCFNRFARIWPQ